MASKRLPSIRLMFARLLLLLIEGVLDGVELLLSWRFLSLVVPAAALCWIVGWAMHGARLHWAICVPLLLIAAIVGIRWHMRTHYGG